MLNRLIFKLKHFSIIFLPPNLKHRTKFRIIYGNRLLARHSQDVHPYTTHKQLKIELLINNYFPIVNNNIPLACGKTRNSSPLLEYFKTLELQYPSAMKMSPVEAMATEVG